MEQMVRGGVMCGMCVWTNAVLMLESGWCSRVMRERWVGF